ncbi:MAG TPA: acyl carrier protein [Longimicrobium sp.]|jgi:acyl carrier protein
MSRQEIEKSLHDFVARELLDGDADDLTSSTNLLALGVIDSLSMVSLRTFVEQAFRVRLPEGIASPEDFSTLSSIAALVERLKTQPEGRS